MQLAGGRRSASTETQPDTKAEDYLLPQVDSQQMSDQLTAAPRIPRDIKVKAKEEEAPPPQGVSVANMDDASNPNAISGVFNEQARPKVDYVPYPVVTIAAEVADGLLIQKTQPVYPKDAWYDHVAGKVVLEATVSRTGSVENLRFVSGPHLFQQAALDAVKT